MAEEVGFEPTVPCGTTVFKTAAFDHSATPPLLCELPFGTPEKSQLVPAGQASYDGELSLSSNGTGQARFSADPTKG